MKKRLAGKISPSIFSVPVTVGLKPAHIAKSSEFSVLSLKVQQLGLVRLL